MIMSLFELSYWTLATIIIGAIAILPTIMGFFSKNKFEVAGKVILYSQLNNTGTNIWQTILITGASQGMGKAAARQLSAKGANIIIVARDVAKLEAALVEVKVHPPHPSILVQYSDIQQAAASNPSSQNFHFISADLTTSEGNNKALAEATNWNNGRAPDVVWCIAGDSYPQFFLETPVDMLRWQMDINYWAAAYMSHATLKSWLSPSSPSKGTERHFIFTSSVIAFYALTGYGTYGPAKAAMRNLSDTLRQEVLLYGEDVKIHCIFPGSILSPGLDKENISKPGVTALMEETDPMQTPDEVAAVAIRGLERGHYSITVNWLGDIMRGLSWHGAPKSRWLWDTLVSLVSIIVAFFVSMDLDSKVRTWGKKHGHPSGYVRK